MIYLIVFPQLSVSVFPQLSNSGINFVKKNALKNCVTMTHTTLFDQNNSVFLDAIMNPELVLKLPKV